MTGDELTAVIGDARVVGLGESLHAVADFYRLKDRLFRELVERHGFRIFALEAGFAEGLLVDRWLNRQTEADLDDVLRRGFTYNMGCCEEFAAQLEWMRAWNDAHPDDRVRYAGTDLPGWLESSAPAIDAALAFLDVVDPDAAAQFRAQPDACALGAWLRNREPVYARRSTRLEVADARRAAEVAAAHDAFLAVAERCGREAPATSSARDLTMAETLRWLLDVHGPDARVVFGAHNGHLQKQPPWGGADAVTVGGYLAHHLGQSYVAIGTTFGVANGFDDDDDTDLDAATGVRSAGYGDAEPDTVDHAMRTIDGGMLDLRGDVPSSVRDAPRMRIQSFTIPIDVVASFDALVHLDRVSFFSPRSLDRPDG